VAVVLSLVQTKQVRIKHNKWNNTITQYKQYKTQPNKYTFTKKPHIQYTHPHITKQVKTIIVQDTHQMK